MPPAVLSSQVPTNRLNPTCPARRRFSDFQTTASIPFPAKGFVPQEALHGCVTVWRAASTSQEGTRPRPGTSPVLDRCVRRLTTHIPSVNTCSLHHHRSSVPSAEVARTAATAVTRTHTQSQDPRPHTAPAHTREPRAPAAPALQKLQRPSASRRPRGRGHGRREVGPGEGQRGKLRQGAAGFPQSTRAPEPPSPGRPPAALPAAPGPAPPRAGSPCGQTGGAADGRSRSCGRGSRRARAESPGRCPRAARCPAGPGRTARPPRAPWRRRPQGRCSLRARPGRRPTATSGTLR